MAKHTEFTKKEDQAEQTEISFRNTDNKDEKIKETFFGRIFRKIIDSGIPIKKALNVIFIGYFCGIILTIIYYNYFTNTQLNLLRWIVFVVLGFVMLLLSYSKEVRCTTTVVIPILCSSKGRSLIIAVAFFLAATGPAVNMFYNFEVMVTSLTCGQMQLKEAFSNMLDAVHKPLVAIKEAIRNTIRELKKVVEKVEVVLLKIKELIIIILANIKNAFNWLENVVKMCNTEFGTPFERCMNISKIAMEDCVNKLGPIKSLCHLTHVFSTLCQTAKVVDAICVLIVFFDDSIISTITTKLEKFMNDIKNLFDVSISFEHDFYFKTTTSKDLEQIKAGVMADVQEKMRPFVIIFGWLDLITLVLLIIIVMKAIYFRLKYVHNISYQNYYITNEFNVIDEKREISNMKTVLPLSYIEREKHPGLTECRLTKNEWLGIARSCGFLFVSTIELFCICFADYCFFWVLALISFYGHKELGLEVPPYITLDVEGGGFAGEVFRGIVWAFEPVAQNYTLDPNLCLPNPKKPNFLSYYLIANIVLLAWVFMFFEPYGLRLRHIIMRLYYPEVAQQRAVWLYNKILTSRITFFKLARRRARLLYNKNSVEEDVPLLDWLRVRTQDYWICRSILGETAKDKCTLCATPLNDDDVVKCNTFACSGIYCENCFKESLNLCCLCNKPYEYGDFSDISDVEDSSEDPDAVDVDEIPEYCLGYNY